MKPPIVILSNYFTIFQQILQGRSTYIIHNIPVTEAIKKATGAFFQRKLRLPFLR